jgi:hypothetical protein
MKIVPPPELAVNVGRFLSAPRASTESTGEFQPVEGVALYRLEG